MQAVGLILGGVFTAYFTMVLTRFTEQRRYSRLDNARGYEAFRQGITGLKQRSIPTQRLMTPLRPASTERPAASQRSRLGWDGCREFTVARIDKESACISSFFLEPVDQKPLPSFRPGQFLAFPLIIPGHDKPVLRCYTISSQPNARTYRVTVKRVPNGVGSNFFHDSVEVGTVLDVKAPRGRFAIDADSAQPLVLIAGGVGITPFSSMLEAISQSNPQRRVVLFYSVKNGTEHSLKDELCQVIDQHENFQLHTVYSSPNKDDRRGFDYDSEGRISLNMLREVLGTNDYHFYICGPEEMTISLTDGLQNWGVPAGDIFSELFEASRKKTVKASTVPVRKTEKQASAPVEKASPCSKVVFGRSGKSTTWHESVATLHNLASLNGVEIESMCGSGNCGACQTKIRSGQVAYSSTPGFECEQQSCLPCVAVPDGDLVLEA